MIIKCKSIINLFHASFEQRGLLFIVIRETHNIFEYMAKTQNKQL